MAMFIDEITIANEGATATYTIVPATEPSADLVVRISSSDLDSVTVSPIAAHIHRGYGRELGHAADGNRNRGG